VDVVWLVFHDGVALASWHRWGVVAPRVRAQSQTHTLGSIAHLLERGDGATALVAEQHGMLLLRAHANS
jgi:hypothetical protein